MSKSSPLPLAGLLHLLVVYVVWGSTYLAIRLAVREGSGFPPFTLGAARLLVAGALLMAWAAWRGGGRGGLGDALAVLALEDEEDTPPPTCSAMLCR